MDSKLIRYGLAGAVIGAGIYWLGRLLHDDDHDEDDRPPIIVSNGSVEFEIDPTHPYPSSFQNLGNGKKFSHVCQNRWVKYFHVEYTNPSGKIKHVPADLVELKTADGEFITIGIEKNELVVTLPVAASTISAKVLAIDVEATDATVYRKQSVKGTLDLVEPYSITIFQKK